MSGRIGAREVSFALVAVGVVVGTALDRPLENPPATRGGYQVLEADFHAHTRFSDGFLSPPGLVLQAERRGLDVLAVTEHNMVFPAKIARWFSELIDGPTILVGAEFTTDRFHLHGIGLDHDLDPRQPLSTLIDAIHEQGGVAIAAHPVKKYWPNYEPVLGKLDGSEVLHPIYFRPRGVGSGTWNWEDMVAFWENAKAAGHDMAAIGSSDYHFFSPLGVTRTLVFATDRSAEAVMEALKARRTVAQAPDGRMWGDPEMIALLEAEPYTPIAPDYDYEGAGAVDVVARTAGWVGMIGLILFGWRRRA